MAKASGSIHLAKGISNFGPDCVDIIVQSLQGKDFELRLLVSEEGEDARC